MTPNYVYFQFLLVNYFLYLFLYLVTIIIISTIKFSILICSFSARLFAT